MPRTRKEILERFQNMHLLDRLGTECKQMDQTNRETIKNSILEIINDLPNYYMDVKNTMLQRAKMLDSLSLDKAKVSFLGTLATFPKDFENDFKNNFSNDTTQINLNKKMEINYSLENIISEIGLEVAEMATLPPRPSFFESVSHDLHESVKRMLEEDYPNGIYRHQACGIKAYLAGEDVCLATSTASGKSLVFSAAAADLLMRDPSALVIAMYPARALVQDQLTKWKIMGQKLGITVGQIDGSVPINQRYNILQQSNIVVMTPDVIHAWLMRELSETNARLQKLKLLILDEAHVYTGVFGTNMAYLMRRISAACGSYRIIAATATIGEPEEFLKKITGRGNFRLIGDDLNGAPSAGKSIKLVNLKASTSDRLIFLQALLRGIAVNYPGKFIAFSDSRVGVETMAGELRQHGVMPYRSGYEDNCRKEIQNALNSGELKGVISTSALEIGVDIQDIDLVVILNYPPTINAFRQRLGRAGRANQLGECLIIDTNGLISGSDGGLGTYIQKPAEVAHLYLGNRALEFGNAMCAFDELSQLGLADHATDTEWTQDRFRNLPITFHSFLANEKEPILALPSELKDIQQEVVLGGTRPQLLIPLRGVFGADFKLRVENGNLGADLETVALGYLTAAQRFREAYPGAIHRHLGIKYRVTRTRRGPDGWEIILRPLPNSNSATFTQSSKFILPIYNESRILKSSSHGFVTAAMVEINERIDGFNENHTFKAYDSNSHYFKKPFGYVRRSCGVIWFLGEDCADVRILELLADSLSATAGISSREIGFGKVNQKSCPVFDNCGTAFVIYDDTPGNFFLTDDLIRYWPEVVERAKLIALSSGLPGLDALIKTFEKLHSRFLDLQDKNLSQATGEIAKEFKSDDNEWFLVVADGEKVLRRNDVDYVEHIVSRAFMTKNGLKYELEGIEGGFEEVNIVPASLDTRMEWCNSSNIAERRPYEVGPDYFVLQDLRNYIPGGVFELRHGKIYKMKPASALLPGKIQLIRDPRIPGGIAFGLIQSTKNGWFRVVLDNVHIASFKAEADGSDLEWVATNTLETTEAPLNH